MANSHVLKFTPSNDGGSKFGILPSNSLIYKTSKMSDLYRKPYIIDSEDNLPDRCGSIAHSVIDNLKMQEKEDKGSPIAPTDNHVAVLLFMLSHYIADAHMPFHCDSRRFSEGIDLHGKVEEKWEDEVRKHFDIDYTNERFFYNKNSYPLNQKKGDYNHSFLKQVEDEINNRKFLITYGQKNDNVREFMGVLCQYSYLLSYMFVPQGYDDTNVTNRNWQSLPGQQVTFNKLSYIVLSDAIDSIARIWLRVWRRYMKWKRNQR